MPRLLYIADVPVSDDFAGAQLMHRLLRDYPPERLLILSPGGETAALHGVRYRRFQIGWRRLMRTRLVGLIWFYRLFRANFPVVAFERAAHMHRPQAILTIAQGSAFIAAARLARRWRLPLHLIVHDDWPNCGNWPPRAQAYCERLFARLYRGAATRLCVSPAMEAEYVRRYGVRGTVIYPSFDPAVPVPERPAARPDNAARLRFVYAGSVNSLGLASVLLSAGRAIVKEGHGLTVYCPAPEQIAEVPAMRRAGIAVEAALPAAAVRRVMIGTADVLLLPAAFTAGERAAAALAFPTKLADYLSTGLPLLVIGPPESSICRWALEHAAAAGLATDDGEEAMLVAVRAAASFEARAASAAHALAFARRHLAYPAVRDTFYRSLRDAGAAPPAG